MNTEPLLLPFASLPPKSSIDPTTALLSRMARRAGEAFREAAAACMVNRLAHGEALTGEQLTDACKEAGIRPPAHMDDRAFGPVFLVLSKSRRIVQVGTATRTKGHGTSGARLWRLR
jgi:hypothetical protein